MNIEFDYGTLLNRKPIKLSIGTLRKPTLNDIYDISFSKFDYYEFLLKLTPESYYTIMLGDDGKQKWDNFSDEEKGNCKLFDIILNDENLQSAYTDLLNFFFVEDIIFLNPYFLILKDGIASDRKLTTDDIICAVNDETLHIILSLIQQICCIYEKPTPSIDDMKFKNSIARKLYEKIQKAQEKQNRLKKKKGNKDYILTNLISAVSNRHPDLNPISVWDLTVFQLIDSFNRLQINAAYEINKTRVSVWGDEKKTFDPALWYKNNNDN